MEWYAIPAIYELNNIFYYLPASAFLFSLCFESAIFFHFLAFLWAVFVRACCRRASTYCCVAVPQALHSTAQSARTKTQSKHVPIRGRQRNQAESIYCIAVPQARHSTAQSARTKPQSKYVPIRARQRKQADRFGEGQHTSSSIYTARRVLKTNEEIEICPASENMYQVFNCSHSAGCGAWRIRL